MIFLKYHIFSANRLPSYHVIGQLHVPTGRETKYTRLTSIVLLLIVDVFCITLFIFPLRKRDVNCGSQTLFVLLLNYGLVAISATFSQKIFYFLCLTV